MLSTNVPTKDPQDEEILISKAFIGNSIELILHSPRRRRPVIAQGLNPQVVPIARSPPAIGHMFRISFHQFRCWENLTIEAPIGGVTLIKGNSGVGKTTILQGITWCLYGNIRLVAPNHMEKAKTRVIIAIPYAFNGVNGTLTIDRQKNPGRLILTHSNAVYEDKVAQAIIDDLFGTYDIWLASCYIGQGCRNNFLTAPNTGKMELLNSIAFHEEDPTIYIERIDTALTNLDTEYQIKLSAFTNRLNSLQTLLAGIDITKALSLEQTGSINSQIETLVNDETRLRTVDQQRNIDMGILNNFQKQLASIANTMITVPNPEEALITLNNKYQGDSLDTLELINANITRAINMIPILQRRDDLDNEIRKIDSLLLPYVNYTNVETYTASDYQDAISKETALRDNQRAAQHLNVLYSESVIRETISQHRNILASQERLKLEYERDNLQNQIGMMEMDYAQQSTPLLFPDIVPQEIPIPDYTKYATGDMSIELTELSKKHGAIQAHIQHLQKGHDVLQCPQCKGSLRYQQGTLVLADTNPTNRDEITAAQQQLAGINIEIAKLNRNIQNLIAAESAERNGYERAVVMEQKRIDSLREKVKQLELEKQRRDIAKQSRMQQILDAKVAVQKLTDSIILLPEVLGNRKLLSPKEIEQTHSLIGRLSNISIVNSPLVSSQQIQSCLNYQDLLQKNGAAIVAKNQYLETIPIIFQTESIRNLNMYIEKLRAYWNRIKDSAEERIRVDRLKISLQDQITTLTAKIGPDVTSEIQQIRTQISDFRKLLSLSVEAYSAIKHHNEITKEREEVVKLNTDLGDLQTFRQHAVETECRILQQVVDSINTSIQGVCGTLFDRDINITLSLFKTLKTTKNVKPVANFAISYQGGVFDNINQMSGGEGDRASLALTLALNRLSSCPILMLDESLASLDLNMKEAAIKTIRENTNNTVLIIMHDGIEGVFDHVINIDEIRERLPLS